ncbi:hypothetical protein M0811_03514 [Anaeramoeba ignava]|uniref:Uncharacterized protein n=1 Tax=Anaeramoeba ignava TaxID=1746090 RepID=A0A9Q0L5A4_ANAIG|nr:hypothetical protein M0811_03514 [Anaeramoeba ignava]
MKKIGKKAFRFLVGLFGLFFSAFYNLLTSINLERNLMTSSDFVSSSSDVSANPQKYKRTHKHQRKKSRQVTEIQEIAKPQNKEELNFVNEGFQHFEKTRKEWTALQKTNKSQSDNIKKNQDLKNLKSQFAQDTPFNQKVPLSSIVAVLEEVWDEQSLFD